MPEFGNLVTSPTFPVQWIPPPPPEPEEPEDPTANQVEVDLDEEFSSVLEVATEDEIVDLAGKWNLRF